MLARVDGHEASAALPPVARERLARERIAVVASFGCIAALWWAVASGLVSSNDGSHLALARALALRGETQIDEDVALTLWVDRAHRDGHDYSDRPPGTAWLAVPAVWIGDKLDRPLLARSRQAFRDGASVKDALVVQPATRAFLETYGVRVQRHGASAPALAALQGTTLLVTLHAIAVGLVGLALVWLALVRRGVGLAGRSFAVTSLGVATAFGPYSTVLFSHATAAVLLLGVALASERAAERARIDDPRSAARRCSLLAGVLGAWAIATDYALAPAAVALGLLLVPRKLWLWSALGAALVLALLAAYHTAAFGAPWRIGYDFQTNFAFARDRVQTFSGDWFAGAWTLWGAGRGAGVAVQAPVVVLGVVGMLLARAQTRRMLLGLLPWLLLLPLHQTPWGGATLDHRYLVPLLPFTAIGLGALWQDFVAQGRSRTVSSLVALVLVLVAAASAGLTWTHTLAWRGLG